MLSMTGFGSAVRSFSTRRGQLEVGVEIRTVNSKFLDLSLRSPKNYVSFDGDLTKLVRSRLKRGRVDLAVSIRVLEGAPREITVNLPAAKALQAALVKTQKALKLSGKVTLTELLRVPDWVESNEASFDRDEEWAHLKQVADEALDKVVESRRQEGAAIKRALLQHRLRFEEVFREIKQKASSTVASLRDRLKKRIEELHGAQGLDPQRLEQEITFYVARSDFREEIDRIDHHLTTFDALMKDEGEHGRKVEFLVQELHREVNTLGSKLADAPLIPLVIELKTQIERIREQIQNSE